MEIRDFEELFHYDCGKRRKCKWTSRGNYLGNGLRDMTTGYNNYSKCACLVKECWKVGLFLGILYVILVSVEVKTKTKEGQSKG